MGPMHQAAAPRGLLHVTGATERTSLCCLQVQLTMVLYDQLDYNRARRWRLPKRTMMPGEYQVTSCM